jgi:hypothetical protein
MRDWAQTAGKLPARLHNDQSGERDGQSAERDHQSANGTTVGVGVRTVRVFVVARAARRGECCGFQEERPCL